MKQFAFFRLVWLRFSFRFPCVDFPYLFSLFTHPISTSPLYSFCINLFSPVILQSFQASDRCYPMSPLAVHWRFDESRCNRQRMGLCFLRCADGSENSEPAFLPGERREGDGEAQCGRGGAVWNHEYQIFSTLYTYNVHHVYHIFPQRLLECSVEWLNLINVCRFAIVALVIWTGRVRPGVCVWWLDFLNTGCRKS